jgi:large subunit ribosomal protein L19
MDKNILKNIEEGQLQNRPDVMVGDTVKLHLKIKEGNKERTQIFEGVVISMKGAGIDASLTVRKISYGIGVEKILPMHSPVLQKIEIVKRGTVRRAKLYFLRDRIGKRALKVNKIKSIYLTDEVAVPETGEAVEEVVTEVPVEESVEVVEEKTEA